MTLNGSSVRKPRYRCKYHTTCKNASIETSEVIEAVCKAIEEEIENFEVRLNQSEKDEQKRKISEIKVVERRIAECENKEVSLWEKYTDECMPKRIFDQLLEKNTSEKERLLNELKSLKNTINIRSNCEDAITSLSEALEALRNREASAEKQNALLKACIDKITYSRESPVRVTKEYKGPTKNGWTIPDFHLHIDFKI
jgi:DNA repair exonuclease SbcCD ATPase subunit